MAPQCRASLIALNLGSISSLVDNRLLWHWFLSCQISTQIHLAKSLLPPPISLSILTLPFSHPSVQYSFLTRASHNPSQGCTRCSRLCRCSSPQCSVSTLEKHSWKRMKMPWGSSRRMYRDRLPGMRGQRVDRSSCYWRYWECRWWAKLWALWFAQDGCDVYN